MATSTITQEIIEQVSKLSPELQRRVLDYARTLEPERVKGVSGKDLLRFAGTISKEDLQLMAQAIEEGCEQIDMDSWD